MIRLLSTFVSAICLLVCMATCALWVRSYYANDWFGRVYYTPGIETEDHHLWLQANRGVVELVVGGDPVENFTAVRWQRRQLPVGRGGRAFGGNEPKCFRTIGISWEWPRLLITGETTWCVRVQLALPAALTALVAILCFKPWHRWQGQSQAGSCVKCGYDLRATPERCPECGTETNRAALDAGPRKRNTLPG